MDKDCRNCLNCKVVLSKAILYCKQNYLTDINGNNKIIRLNNHESRDGEIKDRKLFREAIICPSFDSMDEE